MATRATTVAALIALSGLSAHPAAAQTPDGDSRTCALVAGQEVCTWVRADRGAIVELGAAVPLALIEGVDLNAEMTWPPAQLAAIPLPGQARDGLGIDHFGINWEAHGHPPGPFMTPHFDFHFYSVTGQELEALDCADPSKPSSLPAGYALPDIDVPGLGMLLGLCVPRMGMHAMPADEMESEAPFSATMVMGYYGGEAIFFEPMVSRDRLLARSSFELDVPRVHLPDGVRYPTRFSASYDGANDRYELVMTGFHQEGGR